MLKATLTIPTDRFNRVRGALTDMSGPLDQVGYWVAKKWMPALFKSAGQGTWAAVARGGSPLWDQGILANAFSHALGMDRRSVVVVNPMKYAKAQNDGMEIRAKNAYKNVPGGPYLAIPLVKMAKSAGPRDFGNTFVQKSRNGNWMVFQTVKVASGKRKGQTRKAKSKFASRWTPGQTSQAREAVIKPLFLLRSSVKLKKRPFMKWFPEMKAEAIRICADAIAKAMKAA